MELVEESYHTEDCSVKPSEAFTKFWKLRNTGELLFSILIQFCYMPTRTCVFRFVMQIVSAKLFIVPIDTKNRAHICLH